MLTLRQWKHITSLAPPRTTTTSLLHPRRHVDGRRKTSRGSSRLKTTTKGWWKSGPDPETRDGRQPALLSLLLPSSLSSPPPPRRRSPFLSPSLVLPPPSLPTFRSVEQPPPLLSSPLQPRLFCFVLSAAAVHHHGSSRDNLKIQSCSSQPPKRDSVACAVSRVGVASTRFGWILVAAFFSWSSALSWERFSFVLLLDAACNSGTINCALSVFLACCLPNLLLSGVDAGAIRVIPLRFSVITSVGFFGDHGEWRRAIGDRHRHCRGAWRRGAGPRERRRAAARGGELGRRGGEPALLGCWGPVLALALAARVGLGGLYLRVRIHQLRRRRRQCRRRGHGRRTRQEVVRVGVLAGRRRRRPGGRAGRDHQGQPGQGWEELPHLPPRPWQRRRRVRRRDRARLFLQGRPLPCPQAVRRDLVQDQRQQVSKPTHCYLRSIQHPALHDCLYMSSLQLQSRIKISSCVYKFFATANLAFVMGKKNMPCVCTNMWLRNL